MLNLLRKIYYLPGKILMLLVLKLNGVKKGKNISIRGTFKLFSKGKFTVGNNFIITSSKYRNIIGGSTYSSIVVKKGAELKIGDNVKLSNSSIYCATSISIGNNVMIGGSCKIWDTDFHPLDPEIRRKTPNENYKTKPIVIEDDAFIGGFSIILKGVTIGKGAVVGAGSVVTKDIPAGEVWAGNPAGKVKGVTDGFAERRYKTLNI